MSRASKAITFLMDKTPIFWNYYVQPRLKTFIQYAKVELIPPTPTEIPEIIGRFNNGLATIKNGSWRRKTVKEAWLDTLIASEIIFIFFVGECIGKRHIIGYKV